MNLETTKNGTKAPMEIDDLFDDLDFKPITSGLGFHQKNNNPKPAFTDRVTPQAATQTQNSMMSSGLQQANTGEVYQNDLSAFYNNSSAPITNTTTAKTSPASIQEIKKFKVAASSLRLGAFVADMLFISFLLSIVVIVMARIIHMDAITAWRNYPQEITPLVVSLFVGFYLIYFSVFDKFPGASFGKTLLNLRVVTRHEQKPLGFSKLLLRSFITLIGFLSLGLFSYFDLQNKMTNSEVVRNK